MKYESAINQVVKDLVEELRSDLVGLILGGSVAYGTPLERSDVDIFAVIQSPWHQRRSFIVQDADIELLIKPVFQIKKEFKNTDLPATIAIFAQGKVLYDAHGGMSDLVEEAKNIWVMGRPAVDPSLYPKLRHIPVDLLKDAEDLLPVDQTASIFVMYSSFQAILDVYYKLEGRWTVKPKYQLHNLHEHNPKMEQTARRIMDDGISVRERLKLLSDLIDDVLKPIGGRLGEWQSKIEPLNP